MIKTRIKPLSIDKVDIDANLADQVTIKDLINKVSSMEHDISIATVLVAVMGFFQLLFVLMCILILINW